MTAARKLPPPQQEPTSLELPVEAAARAAAEAAERSPKRASAKEFLARGLKGADMQGFAEAAQKYNGDAGRELADLQAGAHPLQRRRRAR